MDQPTPLREYSVQRPDLPDKGADQALQARVKVMRW